MVRTVRQLVETAKKLVHNREILVKNEDGEFMVIDTVSRVNSDTEPNEVRYILNCKKAGNGCVKYNI